MDISWNPDHLCVGHPQESCKSRSICLRPTGTPTYSERCLRLPEAPKITIFAITEQILPQFPEILPHYKALEYIYRSCGYSLRNILYLQRHQPYTNFEKSRILCFGGGVTDALTDIFLAPTNICLDHDPNEV